MFAVTVFLALLAVAVQVCIVVTLVAVLVGRLRGRSFGVVDQIGRDGLRLAALIAVVAMAGSLYYSLVKEYTPCELCWYQRIAMYPLAFILPIAAWRSDRDIWRYVAPVIAVGAVVSAYHVQLERFPDQDHLSCATTVPCTLVWFTEFGYITLPVMALTAFVAIGGLVALAARVPQRPGGGS